MAATAELRRTPGYSGTPLAKKLGIKERYILGRVSPLARHTHRHQARSPRPL